MRSIEFSCPGNAERKCGLRLVAHILELKTQKDAIRFCSQATSNGVTTLYPMKNCPRCGRDYSRFTAASFIRALEAANW